MAENYYEIPEETIEVFNSILGKKSFPFSIGVQFIGNSKQKKLIKVSKISTHYNFLLNKELLVSINDDLMSVFDDEDIEILMEQEIDRIIVNIDSGKIKLGKPEQVLLGLVNKHGIEKVNKANQVEELYHQQKKDSDENEFIV